MPLNRCRSFTLIELLMVIGVIVILAGILIFNFTKAKERALTKEAIANLKLIAAAEKVYKMENDAYYEPPDPANDIPDINQNLKLYFTNQDYWDYTITTAGTPPNDTFTATADRVGGPYPDCIFTVNQSSTEPAATDNTKCP